MKCLKCGKDATGHLRDFCFAKNPHAEIDVPCHDCGFISVYPVPMSDEKKEAKMTRAERELHLIREYQHYPLCFGGSEGGGAWLRWVGIPPHHALFITRDEHDVREIHPDVARDLAEWILRGLEEV